VRHDCDAERGQSALEFGVIASALLLLLLGLSASGVAFYQYTGVSAAARYGARWASVVGGTCTTATGPLVGGTDWCNDLTSQSAGSSAAAFWNTVGNMPLQTAASTSQPCATNGSPNLAYFYTASAVPATNSTIVGAVAQRLDTSSSNPGFLLGRLSPGFNLNSMKVCIQLNGSTYSGGWNVQPGDTVTVYVYYPVNVTSGLTPWVHPTLVSSAQFTIE
jgi:hypothetical protein